MTRASLLKALAAVCLPSWLVRESRDKYQEAHLDVVEWVLHEREWFRSLGDPGPYHMSLPPEYRARLDEPYRYKGNDWTLRDRLLVIHGLESIT